MNHDGQIRIVTDGPNNLWQKAMLMLLAIVSNDRNEARITATQVSLLLGVPEKNVDKTLAALTKQGWIDDFYGTILVNSDAAERLKAELFNKDSNSSAINSDPEW